MEAIDQGAATTSQVGDNVVAKSRGQYSSHLPPLVQQPSRENTSFHSTIEVHDDHTTGLDYGPNAPFLGYLYRTGHCLIWHPFKLF